MYREGLMAVANMRVTNCNGCGEIIEIGQQAYFLIIQDTDKHQLTADTHYICVDCAQKIITGRLGNED